MSFVREIQAAILQEQPDLGTVLLRLRLLAARLGSEQLEDWVKHEAEGYPKEVEVPPYRKVGVSYRASFSGAFGGGIRNAPIPPYLIEMHAGKHWTEHQVRESIASVQGMASEGSRLGVNAANLIMLLQGKVYEGLACNSVTGDISVIAVREIIQSVRARIIELTIALEKQVPEAVSVALESTNFSSADHAAKVTQIFNQTIHGNVTHVIVSDNAQVSLAIAAGDQDSMIGELTKAGLTEGKAKEITAIIASEKPESADKPLSGKATSWIRNNAPKAAGGAWKIGSAIATDVLKEAAPRYWGLK